jgi:hypothetical protein
MIESLGGVGVAALCPNIMPQANQLLELFSRESGHENEALFIECRARRGEKDQEVASGSRCILETQGDGRF